MQPECRGMQLYDQSGDSTCRCHSKVQWEQPIHMAIRCHHFGIVKVLINHMPELLHSKAYNDSAPLHRAASEGHLGIVEFLLAHGTDASARTFGGWLPIHIASTLGFTHISTDRNFAFWLQVLLLSQSMLAKNVEFWPVTAEPLPNVDLAIGRLKGQCNEMENAAPLNFPGILQEPDAHSACIQPPAEIGTLSSSRIAYDIYFTHREPRWQIAHYMADKKEAHLFCPGVLCALQATAATVTAPTTTASIKPHWHCPEGQWRFCCDL